MNINKEREAFEAAMTSKGIFDKDDIEKYIVFNAEQNKYEPSLACTEDDEFAIQWMSIGWRMWCEAKKQAIPKGFVLMPKKPTESMIKYAHEHHEGQAYLPYSLYRSFVKAAQEQYNNESL